MKPLMSQLSLSPFAPQSRYSVYKRVVNLVLVIIGVTICVNLWILSTNQAQDWHDNQASQLGRSLVKQSALSLLPAMIEKDDEAIASRLEDIVSDPHVTEAAAYDRQGKLIASTKPDMSVVQRFRENSVLPLVFVEEVINQGANIGYIRIYLSSDQVMRFHDDYQSKVFEQMQVLMLLSALAGALLMRFFYKVRFRSRDVSKS